MEIAGIPVPEATLHAWRNILVYPRAPYFVNEDFRHSYPVLSCLSRKDFQAAYTDLSFHDAYATYAIPSNFSWVILLNARELESLESTLKLELLQLQTQSGRGQIYNFASYKTLLKPEEIVLVYPHTFVHQGQRLLELNHTLWHSFSFETQRNWLATFASEDRSPCLSSTLSDNQWQSLKWHYPALQQLVGFAQTSGPNCFAATLAGLCGTQEALAVSSQWLQTETFLQQLEQRSYQLSNLTVQDDLPQKSILCWHSPGLQHACLYLGQGLVFNKDAQSWFAPRQILRLETVLQNWQDDAIKIKIYTPSTSRLL